MYGSSNVEKRAVYFMRFNSTREALLPVTLEATSLFQSKKQSIAVPSFRIDGEGMAYMNSTLTFLDCQTVKSKRFSGHQKAKIIG